MFKYYLSLIISILIGVLGQLSFKAASFHPNLKFLFINQFILLGFFLYFFSALLYIYSLNRIPLSVAFPSVSISYVIVAYASHLIWNETFKFPQIFALVLIGSGLFLLYKYQ